MHQDFEELDRQRRLKNTKIMFVFTLIFTVLNMVLAYMVVDRQAADASFNYKLLYIIGNAFLMPFLITNTTQIFKRFRNSGSRVRLFFALTVVMFLILLSTVSQLGYKFGNIL
ncbi:MAG: hypothetical protein HRU38_08095 [Saccharospirillaceae bacterium]|nr:hypothetical protein [Pseudomonadales bacterium]NRB78614.1 hypothetical protein [Saccharospirillaceae bacterium]